MERQSVNSFFSQNELPNGHTTQYVPKSKRSLLIPALNQAKLSILIKAGKIKHSGNIEKKGPSFGWRLRKVVLTFDSKLFYYMNDKDFPEGGFELKGYKVLPVDNKRNNRFMLKPDAPAGRVWYFKCSNKDERDIWIKHLQESIPDHRASLIESTLESLNIAAKDLKISDKKIGVGAGGIIRRAIWMKTEVVVKSLHEVATEESVVTDDRVEEFYSEIEILSKLRHPNIVTMFGYSKINGYLCLVAEYIAGGDLSHRLYEKDEFMDLKLKCRIALSICKGMLFLHANKVIHRDLKPQNILVQNWEEGIAKVCDFGISEMKKKQSDMFRSMDYSEDKTTNDKALGTPRYAAPELENTNHNHKVDVFSFACILWEICTRVRVWDSLNFSSAILKKTQNGEREELPEGSPFCELIDQAWSQDPNKRPEFEKIYEILKNIQENKTKSKSKEEKILQSFGVNDKLPWGTFCQNLILVFESHVESVERIRYCIELDGFVTKEKWNFFMKWFSPIVSIDDYQISDQDTNGESVGYIFEEIVDILRKDWFHGFISSEEARMLLVDEKPGSYLFRFSSEPRKYTLSVKRNDGGIAHWRITSQKVTKGPAIYYISKTSYSSLDQIAEIHRINPLHSLTENNFCVQLIEPCIRPSLRKQK